MAIVEDKRWVMQMPPFLVGLSVVFWGVMVQQEVVGLLLGVFLESHNFYKTRWSFSYDHYVRGWHLSIIFALLTTVIYWLDGYKASEIRVVFEWIPLIFSPLVFMQHYGKEDCMPMNTFSFFARFRMKADIREGREAQPSMVNLSAPYFCITLVTAGLKLRNSNFWNVFSLNASIVYAVGILVLFGAFVYLVGRKRGRGFIQFSIFYLLMIFVGKIFFDKMVNLESRFRGHEITDGSIDMDEISTRIGNIEELKLSKKVHWRMWVPENEKVPELIPFAVYDIYENGVWRNTFGKTKPQNQITYQRGTLVTKKEVGNVQMFGNKENNEIEISNKTAFRFLGSLKSNRTKASMPHIPGYFCYGNLVGEEANVEHSPLGGVEIINPDATLHCSVWKHPDDKFTLCNNRRGVNLNVPVREVNAIDEVIEEMGLVGLSDTEVIQKLEHFFKSHFSYSTSLVISGGNTRNTLSQTALSQFLLGVRQGHCEYFATATTLILRKLGIKALYVNGYASSLDEKRGDAYLLRGEQAHAWVRAWVNDRWVQVDLTPPDWRKVDLAGAPSFSDKIADWWKMMKEDFQVWRSDEANAKLTNYIIISVFALVVVWIFIRLWFAKNKQNTQRIADDLLPPWKIMKRFDRWCSRQVGARPVGMPYGTWIQILPEKFPDKREEVDKLVELYQETRFSEESPELLDKIKNAISQVMTKYNK